MEKPPDLEDVLAGLLNGAMLTLLGVGFSALAVWSVIYRFGDLPAGRSIMMMLKAAEGASLLLASLPVLGCGIRMLCRNIAALRGR